MNKASAAQALLNSAIGGLIGSGVMGGIGHLGAKAYNSIAPDDWDLDVGDATRFAALNGGLAGVLGGSIYGLARRMGDRGVQDVAVRGRQV